MNGKYIFSFIVIVTIFSCKKEGNSETYIVNAIKMIEVTGNTWSNVESQFMNNTGYRYSTYSSTSGIYAEVHLPAIDDSNSIVHGSILLNIGTNNRVVFDMFNTDTIAQSVAYAMMLNYHNATVQSITGITFSVGELVENGMGSNLPVNMVLSKLISGQIADQLAITYYCIEGRFTMVLFKQQDGRFIFSYRGNM